MSDRRWIRRLFGYAKIQGDIDDEVRFHLDMRAQSHKRAGMREEEAMTRARKQFGDIEAVKRAMLASRNRALPVWFKIAGSAAFAAIVFTFNVQVARVNGQSMSPTLLPQDRLVINKLAYRIGAPDYGDVVMLYSPLDPHIAQVNRYIAGEGEMVRIANGEVFVNGQVVARAGPNRIRENWGPNIVPYGFLFVLGDNDSSRSDSRWFGFVPRRYLIGKVQARWWPLLTARMF